MGSVVYFSSATGNTRRFVEKLGFPAARIPLLAKDEPLRVREEYVLIVPTYGGGNLKGAVPKQVIKFLNNPDNRALCRGVISSGNTNFGKAYCIAGDIIAAKLGFPTCISSSSSVRPRMSPEFAKDWNSFGRKLHRHRRRGSSLAGA